MSDRKKIDIGEIVAACRLLGLSSSYTTEELRRAFHARLFTVHPDTAATAESDTSTTVDDLIAARDLLQQILPLIQFGRSSGAKRQVERSVENGALPDGGTDGYLWYRRAGDLFGAALERYWRVRLHFSHLEEESPPLIALRKELHEARALFLRVLENHPGGIWTEDAVEQIAKINLWLERPR